MHLQLLLLLNANEEIIWTSRVDVEITKKQIFNKIVCHFGSDNAPFVHYKLKSLSLNEGEKI